MDQITTCFYPSPLGTLQLKATDEALCSLMFINSYKGPRIEVATEMPESTDNPILLETASQLHEFFEGKRKVFELPIQATGTAFQQQVWQELSRIPFGETISYLELSRRIGNEKAIRAVGLANGSNPISIIVPCHRVIGSSGKLVGYGGDLWRKQWLLEHEAKYAKGILTLFS